MADSEDTVAKTQRTSPEMQTESLDRLREVFPQFVKDGEIDFDALKEFFASEGLLASDEKYGLGWAGKSDAFRLIREPATGTLTPQHEASKDWENTQNLFIEGDNLETLKLLQAHYREEVKMIYIDPPYNTGGDFIYRDNFHEDKNGYEERTGQRENGAKLMKNTENGGRHHSYWLTMMYPRLFLAKNLLKDDGVIFISIDDNEVHNLRHIMDEIFGEENLLGIFPRVTKKAGKSGDLVSLNHDYVLGFSKSDNIKFHKRQHTDSGFIHEDEFVQERGRYKLNQTLDYNSIQYSPSLDYEIEIEGVVLRPGGASVEEMEERKKRNPKTDYCWRWSKELYDFAYKNGFIVLKKTKNGYRIYTKTYEQASIQKSGDSYKVIQQERTKALTSLEFVENQYSNDNAKKNLSNLFDIATFDYTKPVNLIKTLSFAGSTYGDIILDFFAGSATTAHAVMQQNAEDGGNRKYIMVQLGEETDEDSEARKAGYDNIAQIARERIRRAGEKIKEGYPNELQQRETPLDVGFKSYKLADSNYRQWDELTEENTQEELLEQAKLFAEKPLVDEYDDESMVYEVLLKEGFGLNSEVKQEKMGELDVWVVNDDTSERRLVVSFAKQLTKEQIESLGLGEDDTFVCFDYALDDETKVNITRNLNVKVI